MSTSGCEQIDCIRKARFQVVVDADETVRFVRPYSSGNDFDPGANLDARTSTLQGPRLLLRTSRLRFQASDRDDEGNSESEEKLIVFAEDI